jgi:site-specific DNA-methyltransferase (adenine-specific)
MINKIYNEDCLDTMSRMEDDSIDLILTSPPYDNMRQYGGNKTYHQRLNETGFSFEFEKIASELKRILKPGGVIMWNIQDQIIKGSKTGNSMRQALYFMDLGLNLHDHLIWEKTGTPFPSPYRYRNVWENMFIFSKGKPTTFNPIMIKNKTGGRVWDNRRQRNHEGILQETDKIIKVKEFGIDKNVWLIPNGYTNTKMFKGEESHPAIFPDELVRRHILSWTNEGDTVYDPFLGSATTTRISKELNRNWIGSEMHKPYFDVCEKIMNYEFISET